MSTTIHCSGVLSGVALLCVIGQANPLFASDQEQIEIVLDTAEQGLAPRLRKLLCPSLRPLRLEALRGGRPFCAAGPSIPGRRAMVLAVASPRSRVSALRAAIERARGDEHAPVRLVVLGSGDEAVPRALDRLADQLDNRREDQSALALSARDEEEAHDVLLTALESALLSEQPEAPLLVRGRGPHADPPALAIASTRYPLQHGELRLVELGGKVRWAAGIKLAARRPSLRKLLTASPKVAGGRAISLVAGHGDELRVNLGGGGDFGSHGLLHLWPGGKRAAPPAAALTRFVREALLGEQRRWRLAPVSGPPALVGAPPWRDGMLGHARFAARHSRSPNRLYLTTLDGLLHAFDARTGDELFTFVPAQLLPRLFAAFARRGGSRALAPSSQLWVTPPRVTDVRHAERWRTVLVYGAASTLLFLHIRGERPTLLPTPAPFAIGAATRRWLTPALAPSRDGRLLIAASYRARQKAAGGLQISTLSPPSTTRAENRPPRMPDPTPAAIDVDRQTQRVHAIVLGDADGVLWRLAAPSFAAMAIAKLAPSTPFTSPPALLRRGAKGLVVAATGGEQESRLVLWQEGQEARICRISELCRCRAITTAQCKAPPPGLIADGQPLLLARESATEALLLLTRPTAGKRRAPDLMLRATLDAQWRLRSVELRRLPGAGPKQLFSSAASLFLVEARSGRRAFVRSIGPTMSLRVAHGVRIESYRELD